MPNPPTPEQIDAWEKTAERLWTQSGWSSVDEDEIVLACQALLAEVKRLREAERTRFEAGGYNIGSVKEACVALDELSGQARAQAALLAMRNMEIKKLLEVVPPNLTTEFASTPRTTPRL